MIFDWAPVAGIIVDLMMLSFICTSVYLAYRRGLVDVITRILAFIIAVVITLALYKPVSSFMVEKTNLKTFFSSDIQTVLSNTSLADDELISEEQVNLPSSILNYINAQAKTAISNGQEAVIQKVSDALAIKLIQLIAMLVVFIIARILLIFAQSILSIFAKLPIISTINKLGGAAYGFLRAIVILYFVLAILSIVATMISNWNLMYAIESSHIGGFLYNHNILMNLFSH